MKTVIYTFLTCAVLGMGCLVVGQDKAGKGKAGKGKGGKGKGKGGEERAQTAQRTAVNPLIAVIDTDGNGVLSPAEIQAAPNRLKTLDKNGDGKLEVTEFRNATNAARVEAAQRPEGAKGGGEKGKGKGKAEGKGKAKGKAGKGE